MLLIAKLSHANYRNREISTFRGKMGLVESVKKGIILNTSRFNQKMVKVSQLKDLKELWKIEDNLKKSYLVVFLKREENRPPPKTSRIL